MSEDNEHIGAALAALRNKAGLSVREIATELGMPHTSYANYETRFKKPYLPMDFARSVADVLARYGIDKASILALAGIENDAANSATRDMEKSLDAPLAVQGSARAFPEYLPFGDQTDNEPSNVRMAERAPDVAHWTWPRDIPVMGTSQCGDDGAFEINTGDPIKYVPRPPSLAGVKGIYAIYTEGESMFPAYRPGELVYAHTRLPLLVGHNVIIQIKPNGDSDTPRSYLKHLISKGAGGYRVKQWNPMKEIFFPVEKVLTVHRVLTLEELLNA
jgi:phage repressor protein C with HTH and peptisase S24 domain